MDCDGDRYLCEDLVGATVIEHQLAAHELKSTCSRIVKNGDVHACMVMNLTTRVCNIYLRKNGDINRVHELNHCRGWSHTQRVGFRGKIDYDWAPMVELDTSF